MTNSDNYLLEREAQATGVVNQLAADLKDDPSRLYYALQFARTYPDSPPVFDLPWGFYQYLLAVNDPRQREALAERSGVGRTCPSSSGLFIWTGFSARRNLQPLCRLCFFGNRGSA